MPTTPISPAMCSGATTAGWQFSAAPVIPQPITNLGQIFTAQYKGQYLAVMAGGSGGSTLTMQTQPFNWSLESTSPTDATKWGVFAAIPLDYKSGPTSIPYIVAPTSPSAALVITQSDPGSTSPFALNNNGVWFAVDTNSKFSVFAPSVQQFYIPGGGGALVPSQDLTQIYGWVFTSVPSQVVGSVLPSGDYYFTINARGGGFLTTSGQQFQPAIMAKMFNPAASVFSWNAAKSALAAKCSAEWQANTMNAFFLTFSQGSPLAFQITDKGGIVFTGSAPLINYVAMPYCRKDSAIILLFRPSAWGGGSGSFLSASPYGADALPASIPDGTYQIKHEGAFVGAQGQMGSEPANWNYNSKTLQLALAANPNMCLLNPNSADICANTSPQSLTVGACAAGGAAATRFLLGQDGTFRDPVTKMCYTNTLLGGRGSRNNTPIIMGHYSLVYFIMALVAWAAFIVIFVLQSAR